MSLIRTFPNTNPSVEKGTYDMEYAGFSVPDTLRDGARAIACELLPKHPLELVLCPDLATAQQDAMTRQIYGLHYPLRMAMERSIVSQTRRLPFMPSSHVLRDIVDDKDETMDFDDFLNQPSYAEHSLDVHGTMENALGWNKKQ